MRRRWGASSWRRHTACSTARTRRRATRSITGREGIFPEAGDGATDPLVLVADLQPDGSLALPYLPDPIATGVTLTGVPGLDSGDLGEIRASGPLVVVQPGPPNESPMAVLMVETVDEAAWQSPRSFRIRLVDGNGPPTWDPAARVLAVQVPQGSVRTLQISSTIERFLDQMALWQEKQATAGGAELQRFNVAAAQGRQWSLSPAATLTLVHATRQPTHAPFCEEIQATRSPGETAALLRGMVTIDRPSTGEIALEAESEEWLDGDDTPDAPTTLSAARWNTSYRADPNDQRDRARVDLRPFRAAGWHRGASRAGRQSVSPSPLSRGRPHPLP